MFDGPTVKHPYNPLYMMVWWLQGDARQRSIVNDQNPHGFLAEKIHGFMIHSQNHH